MADKYILRTMGNKYILKSVDENEDEFAATVTYEFQAEYLHNILEHITSFLKAAGFASLEGLEAVSENDDVDSTEPEDDVEEEDTDTKN